MIWIQDCKKKFVWYIVLVFRLDCTYNNCRGFAPFLYTKQKNLLFTQNTACSPSPSSPTNTKTLPLPLLPWTQLALANVDRGGQRRTFFVGAQLRLYRRNPHSTSATPTVIGQETTPIVLYFKVYALILFSIQDLTMLLLFWSCFNFVFFSFLFSYGLTFG